MWSRDGELVHRLADLPLQEGVPISFSSVPDGPREFEWRSDQPATVAWVEALDGGDADREADERDRLFELAAPFTGEPRTLATFALRFGGVEWGRDDLALASEWWWSDRTQRTWRLRPGQPDAAPELLLSRSFEDRYSDPGDAVMETNAAGHRVLLADGETIYLIGSGASDEGDRPFLDRWDLASGDKQRLFHSQAPYYERPLAILDAERRCASSRAASRWRSRRTTSCAASAGADRPEPLRLTSFPHPTPQLEGLSKELIRYPRADGVDAHRHPLPAAGLRQGEGRAAADGGVGLPAGVQERRRRRPGDRLARTASRASAGGRRCCG